MIESANPPRRTRRTRTDRARGRTAATCRPGIEPLEGRALLASLPLLSLSFPGVGGGELPVSTFSFGATSTTTAGGGAGGGGSVGKPTAGPLTVTLPGSVADPTLLADLVGGRRLAEVEILARTSGPTATPYLTYDLRDVVVTSFQTAVGAGGSPATALTLSWSRLTETYTPTNPAGTPVVATWDQTKGIVTGGGTPAGGPATTPVGLSFGGSGELAATAFAFGATSTASAGAGGGGSAGKPTAGPLTVTLDGSAADPALLADLAGGRRLATAEVRVRSATGAPVYLTYDLSDVVVTSIQTSLNGGHQPVTNVTLDWRRLTETYTPTNPDGTTGTPAIATWDQTRDIVTGGGTPAGGPATTPVGLSFGGSGELAATAFAFGATSTASAGAGAGGGGSVGKPTAGPLTVTLDGSAADPALLADLVGGRHLATAEVRVRAATGAPVYLTYDLSDVFITSVQTSVRAGGAAVTNLTLSWSRLTETYTPTNPDGTAGTPVVATWDLTKGTVTGGGTPAGGPATTPVGLSFGGSGELAATAFAFGATSTATAGAGAGGGGSVGKPTAGPLTVTLDGSSADPALLADLAGGRRLATAEVRVRAATGAPVYLTYDLRDVFVTSVLTSVGAGGTAVTKVTLSWSRLSETYTPTNPDGTTGTPAIATWDQTKDTVTGGGTPAGGPATTPVGLSFGGPGELAATAFAFGATNTVTAGAGAGGGSAGKPVAGPLTVTLAGSAADPTLLADLVGGRRLATAEVRVRSATGAPVYLTYDLSDVVVTSVQTGVGAGGAAVTNLTLSWARLTETYTPTNPDGTAGTPVVATWNLTKGTATGGGTPAGGPATTPVGLSFGGSGELAATAFAFGATSTATAGAGAGGGGSVGKPTAGPLTVTLDGSSADPALLADLAGGRRLATAEVRVRSAAGAPVYLTYDLRDVFVTSVQTSVGAGGAAVTNVTLSWSRLSETYSPTNPDGTLGTPAIATWDQTKDTVTGGGTPVIATPVDVTSEFQVTQGGFRFNRTTGLFVQTLTVAFLGTAPIEGPFRLSLDGLTGATLAGASTSANGALAVSGGVFITLPAIGVGQSFTITLSFADPNQGSIAYTPHLLIG